MRLGPEENFGTPWNSKAIPGDSEIYERLLPASLNNLGTQCTSLQCRHFLTPREPDELQNTCESFKQSLNKFEEQITAPNLSHPAPDEHLNDLHKQGFSAIQEGNAYQTYNVDLRNKVSFDIQPTNPQADITATGHCEYWITTIDLMEYQEESTLSSPDDTMLPEVYTDTVACIYNVDGKCKGMLTPERLNILQKAFHRSKCSGLHDHVKPPPII